VAHDAVRRVASLLPIFDWAPRYTRTDAVDDGVAAAIVTIMLVPQSLAYAMLAGLPPQAGLYASILPLVAYALFGSSRTIAVGPVAVVSLMTAAALAPVAPQGSPAYAAAAIALALLSGAVLLAMAALRLGFLANMLSHPVISGFISASGLLIAAGQAKHLLGIRAGGETLPQILQELWTGLGDTNAATLAVGLSTLAFLFWARRSLKPLLRQSGCAPRVADLAAKAGPLVAIGASILAVLVLDLGARGVRLVGPIPAGSPPFAIPIFDPGLWLDLLPAATLIALVGFVESVSVGQTLAARRRQRIVPNQELVGLGASNIAAALSGGFPVTGGFARSIVNFEAGAATPLAGALTAILILVATMFLTPLFRLLPQAVLAATIVVAVLALVDFAAVRRVYAYSKSDFAAMAATIVLVLMVGIEAGIVGGVALSLILFLWRTGTPHVAIVGQVPGTEHFRNVERHAVLTSPDLLSIRIDESLYFANSRVLEERVLAEVAVRPELRNVVLMCSAVNLIDASGLESLEAIAERLASAGIGFHLSEVKGPVMDALRRSDFLAHFRGRIFLSQYEAAAALAPAAHRDA
jgi:sulfate permease, SulP family